MGSIIQPGYRKIIPNMGFVRDDIKGSLIIEFTVNFPDKISKSNIDKLASRALRNTISGHGDNR